MPALAASFDVPAGTTNSNQQTLGGSQTGKVGTGASLTAGTPILWTGGSTAPGVVVDNFGTITGTGSTRGIDTSGSFALGSFTLNNHEGALLTAGDDAFRINTAVSAGTITVNNAGTISSNTGQALDMAKRTAATGVLNVYNEGTIRALDHDAIRPGLGLILIDNRGLIEGSERAINIDEGDLNNLKVFKVVNHAGGEINGLGADTIRITGSSLSTTTAQITIDNAGTIYSGGGQAIDLGDISSSGATTEITNRAGGKIWSTDNDAIKTGANATIKNYGEIDGAGHGITGDFGVKVTNEGEIFGRDGSAVNIDNDASEAQRVFVTNHGTMEGRSADTTDSDGDAIDVDGLATINNYGSVKGLGANGYHDGTDAVDANVSEGIAMGGGTINNYAGGTIYGYGRAIQVDNSENGGAWGATEIYNEGLIQGDGNGPTGVNPAHAAEMQARIDGREAINIVGSFADTITNKGQIIGGVFTDGGDDALTNWGTMTGNIDLGSGENTLENKSGGLLEVGLVLSVGAGNTLNNAGTISPGGDGINDTPTLLTGSLVQSSTGALAIDLDVASGEADRIDVRGHATLDGQIKLALTSFAISSGTVTVLAADGGVSHEGLTLSPTPVALQAALAYRNMNEVQVSYNLSFAPTSIGLNGNQTSLGEHINEAVIADPTSLSGITGALFSLMDANDYRIALDQLSPEIYGDSAVANLYGAHTFGNALLSCRSRDAQYLAVSEDQCMWVAISGRTFDQDASGKGIGYSEQAWGASGGGQVNVAPNYVLGLAGGFEQGNADTSSGASADIARAYAGVSLKHAVGPWYVAGAVFGGTGSADTSRPIGFGGLATTATGDQTISHLSGRLRVAYQAGGNALYVKPMVDLEATQMWLGSVHEQGGVGALNIASGEETIFSAAPAIEIGGEAKLAGGMLLRPFARLGGVFYSEDSVAISSSFVGGPAGISNFETLAEVEQAMGNVGAGLDLMWKDGTTIKAQYDGLFGGDIQQHSFGAKASVNF